MSFDGATNGVRRHAFTGPLLHGLTVFAVPGLVPEYRKDRARFLLCVTGADGHQDVLSRAEIEPEFSRHPVLLATWANGVSLDRCGSRYISASLTSGWARTSQRIATSGRHGHGSHICELPGCAPC